MNAPFLPGDSLGLLITATVSIAAALSLLLLSSSLRRRQGLAAWLVFLVLFGSAATAYALEPSLSLWRTLAVLTAVWSLGLVCALPVRLASSFARRLDSPCTQAVILLGFGVGVLPAMVHRQEEQGSFRDKFVELLGEMGRPQGNRTPVFALTDVGRLVPLKEGSFDRGLPLWAEAEDRSLMQGEFEPVRTALPNPVCNCHGWVFAAGRYKVDCDDVMKIIEDNGYTEVYSPKADDLIVYYNGDDVIHSGVVRSSRDSGPILVESKMALGSRWIHAVEEPPSYWRPWWTHWRFFRSPREGGHCLRNLGETNPDSYGRPEDTKPGQAFSSPNATLEPARSPGL